jgi:Poxvirus A32 protein
MIKLKKNIQPKMTVCKMLCDTGLDAKLDLYEITKFMNQHSTNLLIGKPRSGKTSMLYSLFKSKKLFAKVFNTIYLFQPSASRGSMKDDIFSQLPPDQLYEELTYENLNDCVDRIKNADFEENHCIIFDDMTSHLKNKDTLKLLKELIYNRRHLHTSIFFLVQTWYSVPKDIRKLFCNIFLFKTSKCEIETIFDEVIEQDKTIIPKIQKLVFDVPYNYLFINTDSQRLFKNFDEIIIDEDN